MSNIAQAYLAMLFYDKEYLTLDMTCYHSESTPDGVWVITHFTTSQLKTEFRWFLESRSQSTLERLYNDLIYGRDVPEIVLNDTDCSFMACFKPRYISGQVDIAIDVQHFLEKDGPGLLIRINHATTSIADFQAFIASIISLR